MADLRERLIELLQMKRYDGAPEFSDDEVLRKVESLQNGHREALERETRTNVRFRTLSEMAGPELTKEAIETTPSSQKMSLLSWLDPTGADFLGTGLSLQEWLLSNRISEYQRSFSAQLRDEQRRRIDLVVQLSVEYQCIVDKDLHGTAFLLAGIENIVKGETPERHSEDIRFMLEREGSRLGFGNKEAHEEHERYLEERDKLWAPFIRIARQYTEAFEPPPADRPRYQTWEEMLEKEPGMALVTTEPERIWMRSHEADLWTGERPWYARIFHADEAFWTVYWEHGVRWRGPRLPSEPGYWHMEDGEKFPDDLEKFWGNNYHRIYKRRDLDSWHCRQKEKAS